MPWFVVDDGMYDHPKFLALSDAAVALWVRAGSYCMKHLTDGLVSPHAMRLVGAKPKACTELYAAGLWEPVADGGYRFHDWLTYQRSREDVERKREQERDKKRRQREKPGRDPDTGRYA